MNNPDKHPDEHQVWSYRGYQLRPSEFTTAMVHFFRAEIQRANVWRQRLDTTTNWAVISTGAAISYAFGEPSDSGAVLLLTVLLVTGFLFIEARRYRYYELWSSRVRLMETDFFAAMLVPPFGPSPDWAESLAESLLQPHFPISIWEAIGRRLRRNYLGMYTILGFAWLVKLWMRPSPAASLGEMVQRATTGPIPGELVFIANFAFYVLIFVFGLLTIGLQEASGEVLPRFTIDSEEASRHEPGRLHAWFRRGARRRQLLALIITGKAKEVADNLLAELKRGVTGINGTGMYTGQERSVLLCALTVTEVGHLKALVSHVDPDAFVVVTPAQEVLGRGFSSLSAAPATNASVDAPRHGGR